MRTLSPSRLTLTSTIWAKLGYLLARRAFGRLREKMDPRRVNGGVFLGLEGIVIKSHGGTDAVGFAGAVEIGYAMVKQELQAKIRQTMEQSHESRAAAAILAQASAPASDGNN